ncbi:hypothetical protein, partial [Bacillus altitudinis]|uniref:hypothetical protein n=1 Tax=Bacillus altitudinis TaxID=293387 RepID=UPI001C92EE4D
TPNGFTPYFHLSYSLSTTINHFQPYPPTPPLHQPPLSTHSYSPQPPAQTLHQSLSKEAHLIPLQATALEQTYKAIQNMAR